MADTKQDFDIDEFLADETAGKGQDINPPSPGPAQEAAAGVYGVAKPLFDYAKPVAEFVMQHPIESAAVASYIPGVNKLPILKDVTAARQALFNKYIGKIPGTGGAPVTTPTTAPVTTPTTAPVAPAAEMANAERISRVLTPEELVKHFSTGELPQNVQQRTMPRFLTQPATAPAQAPEAVGTANNFMQRMAALADTYGTAISNAATKAAPYVRGATGVGLATYSPGLNTGEAEQIRRMHELQDQQRAQGLIR